MKRPIATTSIAESHGGKGIQTCIPNMALVNAANMQTDANFLRRARKEPIREARSFVIGFPL
ncbi:MAG: hypothetical protein PVG14_20205, partial [Anaerolineales bacterium]